MNLLKRKYAFLWLVLSVVTCNISVLFLGGIMHVYEKNAWYTKWYYWALGIIFGIFPALIMLMILVIEVNVRVCRRFDVPGSEIYGYPYVWIGSLIIPVVGWSIYLILLVYIYIWYIIGLFMGKAENSLSVR